GVKRYWLPCAYYTPTTGMDRKGICWSVPLLATVLFSGDVRELNEKASRQGQIGNHDLSQRENMDAATIRHKGKTSSIAFSWDNNDHYYGRIRFFMLPQGVLGANNAGTLSTSVRKVSDGNGLLALNRGVMTITGKMVIIGQSSPDKGDIHLTPVGPMPGMYLLGNAINTMIQGLQPQKPFVYTNVIVELFVILLAAFVFLYVQPYFSKIIISAIILTCSIFAYYYFLTTGVFVNFIFPLVGIGVHESVSRFEHLLGTRTKNVLHGFRKSKKV
ncbi:MAG: CHASE2 domain-containing protein, partial [Bacillota bacterium]|nr:CHASE2 domain-containing protein [Bacillota bacterium]